MQINFGDTRYKASITLLLAACGFVISRPFASSFGGGLATSVFEAALVGGLADWFAVTALFRRPLGIPWRTAIIPRQRDKIFQAVIDMVANELLSVTNIKRTIRQYDWAGLLVAYGTSRAGRRQIKVLAVRLLRDFLQHIDTEGAAATAAKILKAEGQQVRWGPLLADALNWSLSQGYINKIWDLILARLQILVSQPKFRRFLQDFLTKALAAYEAPVKRRRLFNRLVAGFGGLTPAQLATMLQLLLSDWLTELKHDQHPLRLKFKHWLETAATTLEAEAGWAAQLPEWQRSVINRLEPEPHLQRLLLGWREAALAGRKTRYCLVLAKQGEAWLQRLAINKEAREAFNQGACHVLEHWLENHHAQIGRLIAQRLAGFTGQELARLIEEKVGNDLQMIRINGSLVGGLVGGLLFLLQWG